MTSIPGGPAHPEYVGHTVVDEHQHEVGTVVDAVYDNDASMAGSSDEQPMWLVVDPGKFRAAHWIPVTGTYHSASGSIVIPWDRELVKHAPKASGDHLVSDDLRRRLVRHYELAD